MRTLNDALRSMARYVSECLSPQPTLAEFTWTDPTSHTTRWTTKGMVQGDIDLPMAAWGFLFTRDRFPGTLTGTTEEPYLTSALVDDPGPAAALAGISLAGSQVQGGNKLMQMPQFEVRFAAERGDYTPPFARVELVAGGGTSGPAFYYERTQPMSIECYPAPAQDAEAAMFAAIGVLDALERGFRRQGVAEGFPLKVPLYDYDNVPLSVAGSERLPHDFMRVLDFAPRSLPDPIDPRRVAAIADVRVAWRIDMEPREEIGQGRGTRVLGSVATDIQLS